MLLGRPERVHVLAEMILFHQEAGLVRGIDHVLALRTNGTFDTTHVSSVWREYQAQVPVIVVDPEKVKRLIRESLLILLLRTPACGETRMSVFCILEPSISLELTM